MSAQNSVVSFPPIPENNRLVDQNSSSSLNSSSSDHLLTAAALAQFQAVTSSSSSSSTFPISHSNKEAAPPLVSETSVVPEAAKLVEVRETEPLPAEVEGWLQKLDEEGDIRLDKPISHDGDVLLANSEAQVVKEKIILPMTQSALNQGLTQKVTDSARWLAEWCLRLIKMMKDKVKYAPEPIKSNQ